MPRNVESGGAVERGGPAPVRKRGKAPAQSTADLFIDLYSYRQRENKNPLEDWLTECLAVTLRVLPAEAKASLLDYLSGASIANPPDFFAEHKVEIFTQYVTPAGRPDLVIMLDDCPWILFENKVGHSVSKRETESGEVRHQLLGYADWLAERGADCSMPQALVFVTHITPPPTDFRDPGKAELYHHLRRIPLAWGDLARRMANLVAGMPENHHSRAIVGAFLSYLENQDMSHEFPSSAGFAAAELYVTQADALENLVVRMWDAIEATAKFGGTPTYELKALTDELSVSAWRYTGTAVSSISNCFFQTGIWFAESGLWLGEFEVDQELRGAQAYVYFGNQHDDAFAAIKTQPDGWMRPVTEFLSCKAVAEFPNDPQARGEEIVAWVAGQARVLNDFLKQQSVLK